MLYQNKLDIENYSENKNHSTYFFLIDTCYAIIFMEIWKQHGCELWLILHLIHFVETNVAQHYKQCCGLLLMQNEDALVDDYS